MESMNQNMSPMNGMGNMNQPKKSYGALIAVVVILLLIIIGGLYFLGQRISQNSYTASTTTDSSQDPVTQSLQTESSSDDLQSIQTDLNSTDTTNLDQGATTVEADLSSQNSSN